MEVTLNDLITVLTHGSKPLFVGNPTRLGLAKGGVTSRATDTCIPSTIDYKGTEISPVTELKAIPL